VKFSLRIAGAVVGVALVATACGTTAPRLVNQAIQAPAQSNAAEQGHQTDTRQANAKAVQDAANVKAAQDAANAKAVQDAANAKAASVTLGVAWAYNTIGYGSVRPSEISAGGDSSGNVGDITWDSWGVVLKRQVLEQLDTVRVTMGCVVRGW
jgi:hypothetical protein